MTDSATKSYKPQGRDQTALWQEFSKQYELSEQQTNQLQKYYQLLCAANELFDLTAIIDLEAVLAYHFADSLEVGNCINFSELTMIADVGSGAGFPGLVLKIKYPALPVVLIEVVHKRRMFLQSVIDTLQLTDIEVHSFDWRTFLRKTEYPIDLFCARASLQPEELLRMFKPGCFYRNARLVYWASAQWEPTQEVAPFIVQTCPYRVKQRRRNYIVCAQQILQ